MNADKTRTTIICVNLRASAVDASFLRTKPRSKGVLTTDFTDAADKNEAISLFHGLGVVNIARNGPHGRCIMPQAGVSGACESVQFALFLQELCHASMPCRP